MHRKIKPWWFLLAGLALPVSAAAADCVPQQPGGEPDWRDQIIYFAMIDRFDDGDPRNNDQGAGEYGPGENARWNGGDLAGLRRRLDYIQGLGATALWIPPPVANQWWNPRASYGGYHGYWAEDFSRVDAHYGNLDDYRALADGLHACGMLLVQDIVVNHTADYFGYGPQWSAEAPARGWRRHADSRGRDRPTRWPFRLNDPRRVRDRRAAVYHWTPDVADYSRREQELDFQMSGLDDLNTENPLVRRALRRSYGDWITRVGVDAFRVDTAFYVPEEFFDDFLHAQDPQAPGILEVARRAGKPGFHVFGEGFAIDRPYEDAGARRIDAYMRAPDGRALLPGMLNFPLYGSLVDVFARGRPTAELAWRIGNMLQRHAQPHLMPTFLDNHDVDRFLASGSEAGLRQGLLALMTLPGIPTLYYGTEQGFAVQRQAMFAAGHASGGRDHFDAGAPLYRYIATLAALRRGDRLYSRGLPTVLASSSAGPGALVWRIDHEGRSALVAFNTAAHAVALPGLETGLPGGARLQPRLAIDGQAPALALDAGGRVDLVLPAGAGWVWQVEAGDVEVEEAAGIRIEPPPATVSGDLELAGSAPAGVRSLRLLLDGVQATAQEVAVAADGRWSARIDTSALVDPGVVHRLQAWSSQPRAYSSAIRFQVQRPWREAAVVADPRGDDRGRSGTYVYPADASWQGHRSLDLLGARVAVSGGALQLEVELADLVSVWNPANGFDHLLLTGFLQMPGRDDGSRVMPLQDGELPDGLRWHYRFRVGGWSNAMFAHEGASADSEGRPLAGAPTLQVDAAARRLRLLLPAALLGNPPSLSGAVLHLATWDYDGGYRALAPGPGGHVFGGGQPGQPRVMDELTVVLP